MEGGGWFSARTQKVSKAHSAIAQPVRREAARSGAPGGVYRRGRGAQSGVRARESAPGQEAPAGLGGGRLTPAAERLHGEDAPPAQHGPAPGPNAAPRPPAASPRSRPEIPLRCLAGGFARASGPGWARPPDPPRGGRGGGARRCADGWGWGGRARRGRGGRRLGAWPRGALRGAGRRPGSSVLRAPGSPALPHQPRSGDLRLRTLSGWRCGVTRHPLTPGSHAGLSSFCLPAAEMQPGLRVEGRRGLDGSAEGNGAPRAGCGKSADRDKVVPALPAVCLGHVTQPLRNLTRQKGEMIPVHMEILSDNCRAP